MPWRREEVAPYHYKEVYIPDSTEQFYYTRIQRTPEERERLYRRANNGEPGGYAELPEDKPQERIAPKEPVTEDPVTKSLAKKATAEFSPAKSLEAKKPPAKKKKVKPPGDYQI